MKDFRAQRIETPDVIEQVAELLYDSPELVLGFNTFLPTGFQITMTDDNKYVFTSPQNQPRVLPTPSERRAIRIVRDPENIENDPNVAVDGPRANQDFHRAENQADDDPMEEEESEDDSEDSVDDEEEQQEEEEVVEPLVEEVVRGQDEEEENNQNESMEEEGEVSSDLSEQTLKVMELLKKSFTARPGKLIEFLTFFDFFIQSRSYFGEKAERSSPRGSNVPSTSQANPEDDRMEVDEEAEKNEEIFLESLRTTSYDHLISMLASCCVGEADLLAATIDFLPYFDKLLETDSFLTAQKIKAILHYSATNDRNDIPEEDRVNPVDIDMELVRLMEKCKMGTSKNEKLRLKRPHPSGEGDGEELFIFNKSYRILFDNLKLRLDEKKLSNLLMLLNSYMSFEVTKEELAAEIPKLIGAKGSETETIICGLLGVNRPQDMPENDPDAVLRQDLPAVAPKRGLRDQKTLQQVKNVEAATVCTLGPSYRLLKNTKPATCSGRIGMDSHLQSVLNDKWISYPSWSSEDSGTQAVKKSNLEEFHFKTEEERYELDIMADSNKTVLEELSKTIRDFEASSTEAKKNFQLDDCLNCTARATFIRTMTKVYPNNVHSIIRAAQKNPGTGLATIYSNLLERDGAFYHFQHETNKAWRDALDKQLANHMTVLTSQQKGYDQKAFKWKPLINAIETNYEDNRKNGDTASPHLVLDYPSEETPYTDVNDVTESFFHELPGGKTDKDRTKVTVFNYRILMEWLCQRGQDVQVQLDNNEVIKFTGDITEDDNMMNLMTMDGRRMRHQIVNSVTTSSDTTTAQPSTSKEEQSEDEKKNIRCVYKDKRRVFYGDDNVYILLRFHHMLLERFAKILASQACYNQEYLENKKKTEEWKDGIGADMHGWKILDENTATRREAVHEIRNIRSDPTSYYRTTIRELKQLGRAQSDMASLDDAIKHLFPGDVSLFNSIDKLFQAFAKNAYNATCSDERENPVKLYLQFRQKLIDSENDESREAVEEEYSQRAEESLRGKNTYRFEFIKDDILPKLKIWVIPREEKESDEDEDDDGNEIGKDEDEAGKEEEEEGGSKDKEEDEEGDEQDEQEDEPPPPSSMDDGDDYEDDFENVEMPSDSEKSNVAEKADVPSGADETLSNLSGFEKINISDVPDEQKTEKQRAIDQTGLDMDVAFNGNYKDAVYDSVKGSNGEMHRIYRQCVRVLSDHRIWRHHKLVPRPYKRSSSPNSYGENKHFSEVYKKDNWMYNYDKINKTRRSRIIRTQKKMELKDIRDNRPCFKIPFVPLVPAYN